MKKFVLPFALVGLVGLQACNQQAGDSQPAQQTTAAAPLALETAEQRLSYGIAFNLGQRMNQDDMNVDVDAFVAGFTDGFGGDAGKMTQEEISAELQAYQERMMAEQQAAHDQAASTNLAASAAFLEENKAREGVVVTDSGLQYEVLEAGEGDKPGPDDTVEVHYRGTLVDGTEFDSSYQRGQTVTFGVGQVIPGWTEALQLMPVGSKWKLFIPPELAYGAGGAGQLIGPNAALVFEVELISIPSQAEGEAAEDAASE
ncbi:FKBP-type peptidyl-prolyl cis-trans isomerase [Mangrovimicrobium sediminis]|uniref:Peptidyl-prolyl cis-trans isomerase n=1 Tax=Mangrovimicrobium sediminis TaxID=2562682 RepID=A0A4Z0M345_9GAMM|nr:FKBP-type peptidyl-prolyl cis-trans isomerase [Haliea sp. SAOS-164]TGD73874.1 FKBP-type peptidyl-prolyl cis-trans isomerase [Haliea sp. SAOS-164]